MYTNVSSQTFKMRRGTDVGFAQAASTKLDYKSPSGASSKPHSSNNDADSSYHVHQQPKAPVRVAPASSAQVRYSAHQVDYETENEAVKISGPAANAGLSAAMQEKIQIKKFERAVAGTSKAAHQEAIAAAKVKLEGLAMRTSIGRGSTTSITASASAFKKSLSSAVNNYAARTHASTNNLNTKNMTRTEMSDGV